MQTKKHRGRPPKTAEDRRTITVAVRFSSAEIAELDNWRGSVPRGRFLRETCRRALEPK